MFFPERVKNISPNDKVLEIGPGAHPHQRSNVLLELEYENEFDRSAQFGHGEKLSTDKKIVFYKGGKFPFADKEFDYVICSHVLEHVEDVPAFLSEVFRVSGKGYFEYPLINYEYLYNFDVHLNLLKWDGEQLTWMKKNKTALASFKPVNEFFLETLQKGHAGLIEELPTYFIEGFEWNKPFETKETSNVNDLAVKDYSIPQRQIDISKQYRVKELVNAILKKITR